MSFISPPKLQKKDRVGIVAPARKISEADVQPAIAICRQWGLSPVLGKHLFSSFHQFSGTDAQRTADMQQFLDDETIRAIIAARGGYGTLRIIDKLNFTRFCQHPKWVVGFSDITVLHAHINQLFKIQTIHAAMPISFSKDQESLETLRKILFGEQLSYVVPAHPLNRQGESEGILVGGNLSLLYALKGTRSGLTTSGKILFIEDVDEYLYHLDRMMIALKHAGKLSHLAGLIVGTFTQMKDNEIPFGKNAEEIIREAVEEYDYPVCFGFPAGHGTKNVALPLGRRALLTVHEEVSLSFL